MSNISESETDDISILCANCGKGEENGINLKTCTACKLVKYCSRECQIAHRPQHKKACKKRAKELYDEKLFKQPPPLEDCPICFQRLPSLDSVRVYMACCGKEICKGCVHAFQSRATKKEHDVCPFCRTPPPTSDEEWVKIKRLNKRMDLNDDRALCKIGCYHYEGSQPSFPQNYTKALELWHRSAEHGNVNAYYNIGNAYLLGEGVKVDEKKTKHYYELAAMRGHTMARHNLGCFEEQAGNKDRALKHFMIAVKDGNSTSLESIKRRYERGLTTKDIYNEALRSYQAYLDEIKSDQRDEAAALYSKYY